MKIVLENEEYRQIDSFLVRSFDDFKKTILNKPLSSEPLLASLFSFGILLNCSRLKELKSILNSKNINLKTIYTQARETAICAKALKINTHYQQSSFIELDQTQFFKKEGNDDLSHKGTIRSGDKISSNGNLFIIGDVNPGAQISAKKDIYVWGKLCGIAIAGKDGNDSATISSLYLNPLQIRISNSVAIGPKEKPNNFYPEIALLESGEIVIKPHIIS